MSGQVKQNLTKKATTSNSCSPAYTSLGSTAAKIDIWSQPFSTARVSPSRLNIGSDVSRIDTKSADVFSLAYGKDGGKYFNTGYNLRDLYPTTNYVSGYRNRSANFLNILTGVIGAVGILASVGSIVTSVKNLFGSKKSEKSETKVIVENPTTVNVSGKKGATEEISEIDGAVRSSKSLSDSNDIEAINQGIEELDASIASAEEELENIDSEISSKESEVLEARKGEEEAAKAMKTINNSVKIKEKESEKLNDALEDAKDAENEALNNYSDAMSKYDKAALQLKKMDSSDPNYSKLAEKVEKLRVARDEAKEKYENAVQARVQAHKDFGKAASELEQLQTKQAKIQKIYDKRKAVTTKKENELKALQTNKQKLPAKIQKAKAEKLELENRRNALNLGKDIELGIDEDEE